MTSQKQSDSCPSICLVTLPHSALHSMPRKSPSEDETLEYQKILSSPLMMQRPDVRWKPQAQGAFNTNENLAFEMDPSQTTDRPQVAIKCQRPGLHHQHGSGKSEQCLGHIDDQKAPAANWIVNFHDTRPQPPLRYQSTANKRSQASHLLNLQQQKLALSSAALPFGHVLEKEDPTASFRPSLH